MRIFLAGASGVIGVRLIPLLVAEGHRVAGMTRSPDKTQMLRDLGADPVVCDVYDAEALERGGQSVRQRDGDPPADRSSGHGRSDHRPSATETTGCAPREPAT